jgi:hypothetical protein
LESLPAYLKEGKRWLLRGWLYIGVPFENDHNLCTVKYFSGARVHCHFLRQTTSSGIHALAGLPSIVVNCALWAPLVPTHLTGLICLNRQ